MDLLMTYIFPRTRLNLLMRYVFPRTRLDLLMRYIFSRTRLDLLMKFCSDSDVRQQSMMDGYMTDEKEDDSEDESVVDNEKSEKSVNMFIAPNGITMSSMSSSTSWPIDSGAGLSGTNNRNLLVCPSTCRVPITPAIGEMITATSESSIRDPRLGQFNIRALHVDKMQHNLLSVHQLREGGE